MTTKPNAILVLNPDDNDQGFLLPQLTTNARLSITPSSPGEDGLLVFDITEKEFYYWKNNGWVKGFVSTSNQVATAYYSIDPADFSGLRPASEKDNSNALIFEDNTTYITTSRKDLGTSLIAPIHLPDGASIQQVVLYYMDRDVPNMTLNIYRKAFAGNNEAIIPQWNSTGVSGIIQSSTHTPTTGKGVIDNSTYSYRVVIALDPSQDSIDSGDADQRIYGLQIKYQK
jgi:hypothetical protein